MMNYAIAGGTFMGVVHSEPSFLDRSIEYLKSAVKRLWRILNQKGHP
ncbi:protease FtsH-inhibitory lysogeny factor CIII [Serratia ureilytica]